MTRISNLFRSQALGNIGANLIGFALPAVVGFISTPLIIRNIGNPSFGFLSLVWLIVGYLGFFDFGLSRSLTQFIAERKYVSPIEVEKSIATSLSISIPFSIMACILFFLISKYINFKPSAVPSLTNQSFVVINISMGILIFLLIRTSILRGVLEGFEEFRISSFGRLMLGVGFFIFPLLVSYFTAEMGRIIASLIIPRLLVYLYYYVSLKKLKVDMKSRYDAAILKRLFSSGLWMTVTNIVSPLMNGLDRIFIANMVGFSAVAFYSVPSDAVGRISVFPLSIGTVLLPKIAGSPRLAVDKIYRQYVVLTAVILAPLCLFLYLLAPLILRLWVGLDYQIHSTSIFRILLLGIFVNGIANVPFTTLQGLGHAQKTAHVHMIEFPIYAAMLLLSVSKFGIFGAAIVWSIRAFVDLCLLHLVYVGEIRKIRV